jgi:hypothetical protein
VEPAEEVKQTDIAHWESPKVLQRRYKCHLVMHWHWLR